MRSALPFIIAGRCPPRYGRGMEPANTIIGKLGGPAALARRLGIHRVSVARWKSHCMGLIPAEHIPAVLAAARDLDVPMTAADIRPDLAAVFAAEGSA